MMALPSEPVIVGDIGGDNEVAADLDFSGLAESIRNAGAGGITIRVTPHAAERHDCARIVAGCRGMELDVWLGVSDAAGVQAGRALRRDLQGIRTDAEYLASPSLRDGIVSLELPIAIVCDDTPLVDLFRILDAVGNDARVILACMLRRFEVMPLYAMRSVYPEIELGLSLCAEDADPQALRRFLTEAFAIASFFEVRVPPARDSAASNERQQFDTLMLRASVSAVNDTLSPQSACDEVQRSREAYAKEFESWRRREHCNLNVVLPSERTVVPPGNPHPTAPLLARQAIGIFCQARAGSTRLPRKALLPFFDNYTCLGYLLKRLISYPGSIGEIILATTQLPEDDELAEIAQGLGVPCFRGQNDNVIGRMLGAAAAHDWEVLVRVTADDLFKSCEYIESALNLHVAHNRDYTRIEGLPYGIDCEVIDVGALRQIYRAVAEKEHTEHVSWYLDSPWVCRNGVLEAAPRHRFPMYRLSLDYPQDYELMRELAERCHSNQDEFYVSTDSVIEALVKLDPAWRHEDRLVPTRREDVNTQLVYCGNR